MPSIFDSTAKFNPEVFRKALENILTADKVETTAVFKRNLDNELSVMFPEQAGGNVATIVIEGNLGGEDQNYDGLTDLTPTNVINYSQSVIAVGRAKAWKEKDFVPSISGRSGLDAQAYQVAMYRDLVVKKNAISTLKGIFASALANKVVEKTAVSETDLNDALVEASGDMADQFDVVVMDSYYAGQLANLKLMSYAKYTDAQGIERVDQKIGYWGGRLVVIDDSVGTNARVGTHYVYALGFRSFKYTELGVKYPFEMARESLTAGGVDMLISRQRFILAPYGVSWKGANTIVSPTQAQLEDGTNWELVSGADGSTINPKVIPFACLKLTIAE